MAKLKKRVMVLIALLACFGPASAQDLKVQETVLTNGLKVLLRLRRLLERTHIASLARHEILNCAAS